MKRAHDEHSSVAAGWLEQAVFRQIQALVRGWSAFQVLINLEVGLTDSKQSANEIDILLVQGEVFHLIEIKTSRDRKHLGEKADKLSSLNQLLSGRPAKAWFCAPFLDVRDTEWVERMKLKGVALLTGRDAVSDLLSEIGKLPR